MKEPIDCCDLSLFQMSLLGQGGRGQYARYHSFYYLFKIRPPHSKTNQLGVSKFITSAKVFDFLPRSGTNLDQNIIFVLSKEISVSDWLREGYPCGFSENDSLLN